MITVYFNWALSLVASALFIPFLCRKNPKTDVRLLAVAAYLGQGTVWHGGLSGSAPLIMATPEIRSSRLPEACQCSIISCRSRKPSSRRSI